MSKQLDKLKATMQRIEAQKAELDQKIKARNGRIATTVSISVAAN